MWLSRLSHIRDAFRVRAEIEWSGRAGNISRIDRRRRIRTWVAREAMPHERKVRAWLARTRLSRDEIDEVIQDSYCRFAMLDTVDHIQSADAYFFATARNLLLRKLQRAKIVPIEALGEADMAALVDNAPSPEREAAGRRDMARLRAYVAKLPDRCRRIVELRKLEGLSQKEIALTLGVSESIVENDLFKGMLAIQQAWRADFLEAERRLGADGIFEARR